MFFVLEFCFKLFLDKFSLSQFVLDEFSLNFSIIQHAATSSLHAFDVT